MTAKEYIEFKCVIDETYVRKDIVIQFMEEYAQLKIDALKPNLEHLNQTQRLLYLLREGDLKMTDAVQQGVNNPTAMISALRKKGYKIIPIEANTYRLINPSHVPMDREKLE